MSEGFIHTASALIDYINDVGFLPLLNVGVAGWSADEAVDEECRYAMRPDGSWEWPLWEWKGEILRESGCAYGKFCTGRLFSNVSEAKTPPAEDIFITDRAAEPIYSLNLHTDKQIRERKRQTRKPCQKDSYIRRRR